MDVLQYMDSNGVSTYCHLLLRVIFFDFPFYAVKTIKNCFTHWQRDKRKALLITQVGFTQTHF